ncbi:MAG: phosphoglucosamine mutase [Patescibacteria group bacterium]|nr:phosphoglucosamine mutase [Patescibacteria group bacterium]
MTLIKSISGIRGTVGGRTGEGLGALETVKFVMAFGQFLKEKVSEPKIIIGRDSRPSSEIYHNLAANALASLGVEVIDAGLLSTPSLQMAVISSQAAGGIIISASHNPNGWNGLKLVEASGEFLTQAQGEKVLAIAEDLKFDLAGEEKFGKIIQREYFLAEHLDKILALGLVDRLAIAERNFIIAVDGINSVGGRDVPELLKRLGVNKIEKLNCDLSGHFAHHPEPLDKNLGDLSALVMEKKCDLGIVVDPDGDRMSLVCEDGSFFNEEYVLVAVADHVLAKSGAGNTVSNLSSSRALQDVTEKRGGRYFPSAVGEVNVVAKMKEVKAVIGGEGNGGVIYPELHYGRDALVGIALFLSALAEFKGKCSELRKTFPAYFIAKNKIEMPGKIDWPKIYSQLEKIYQGSRIDKVDGLRIDFDHEWVQLRPSNTEPIARIYAESDSPAKAEQLAQKMIAELKEII